MNYNVRPSAVGTDWYWEVWDKKGEILECGYASTQDGAFRAARNFIRRNQNLVYGE